MPVDMVLAADEIDDILRGSQSFGQNNQGSLYKANHITAGPNEPEFPQIDLQYLYGIQNHFQKLSFALAARYVSALETMNDKMDQLLVHVGMKGDNISFKSSMRLNGQTTSSEFADIEGVKQKISEFLGKTSPDIVSKLKTQSKDSPDAGRDLLTNGLK